MIDIRGYDIAVTSGDSLTFRVDLTGRELPQDASAVFTVKRHAQDERPAIEKTIPIEDGIAELYLSPQDTCLPPRDYVWDLRVCIPRADGGRDVETPMEYALFTVTEAVGSV